jgi:hypothetical protein
LHYTRSELVSYPSSKPLSEPYYYGRNDICDDGNNELGSIQVLSLPKGRLNAEFINRGNKAANVMTENLTKQFIFLRLITLAAKRAAELCLNHTEHTFDVAALVIVALEPFLIVRIEVIEASPHGIFKGLCLQNTLCL